MIPFMIHPTSVIGQYELISIPQQYIITTPSNGRRHDTNSCEVAIKSVVRKWYQFLWDDINQKFKMWLRWWDTKFESIYLTQPASVKYSENLINIIKSLHKCVFNCLEALLLVLTH